MESVPTPHAAARGLNPPSRPDAAGRVVGARRRDHTQSRPRHAAVIMPVPPEGVDVGTEWRGKRVTGDARLQDVLGRPQAQRKQLPVRMCACTMHAHACACGEWADMCSCHA